MIGQLDLGSSVVQFERQGPLVFVRDLTSTYDKRAGAQDPAPGLETPRARPIDYAANGYPVSPGISAAWERSTELLARLPDSRRVWLPGGRAPRAAELFRNPEFAATLRTIADHGPDAFYTGPIAARVAAAVRADGGVAQDDLAAAVVNGRAQRQ